MNDDIRRYDDVEPSHGLVGDPALVAAVEAHIAEHYGTESTVWRHPISEEQGSPISLRLVRPTPDRPALTAITVGMSERAMGSGDAELSCELVIALPPDWSLEQEIDAWPLFALDQLAHFPHEYKTVLGFGHTIQNPYPWSPSGLTGALIGDQVLAPSEAATKLQYRGREIQFLGAWFLYPDEMQVKLDHGVERLWELCVDAGISEAVKPDRPSFVAPKRRRGFFRRR
jgi:Suppressor of fused protein (SUFU)